MNAAHQELMDLVRWIDQNASGVSVPADERSMLALGCFDVAMEHQAAIAMLSGASLNGSAFALLRVLAESLVRGLWLAHCASETELEKFKRGKVDKQFNELVTEVEASMGTPGGVLSGFKSSAWGALNGFTHTGFHQVARRHSPGVVRGTYAAEEIDRALGIAGALGLIAAGQVVGMSNHQERVPMFLEKMKHFGKSKSNS